MHPCLCKPWRPPSTPGSCGRSVPPGSPPAAHTWHTGASMHPPHALTAPFSYHGPFFSQLLALAGPSRWAGPLMADSGALKSSSGSLGELVPAGGSTAGTPGHGATPTHSSADLGLLDISSAGSGPVGATAPGQPHQQQVGLSAAGASAFWVFGGENDASMGWAGRGCCGVHMFREPGTGAGLCLCHVCGQRAVVGRRLRRAVQVKAVLVTSCGTCRACMILLEALPPLWGLLVE